MDTSHHVVNDRADRHQPSAGNIRIHESRWFDPQDICKIRQRRIFDASTVALQHEAGAIDAQNVGDIAAEIAQEGRYSSMSFGST